jgi:two-component system sensor kinase FixL
MGDPRRRPAPRGLRDLQVADARWRAVLSTARDAIISIDANGLLTLFNPAAEDMFGYRAEEIVGRNVTVLMPSPYREEHDGYLARYQRTGDARAIGRIRAVQGQRKNGSVFPIELSVSESRLGDEVLYTAILRDITEQLELRELQRTIQERTRLADIGAITAKVVHDLGNPLAALSMQAQLIMRRARRGDFHPVAPVQGPAEQILHTLKRLEGLIHEFTDFAREQRLDVRTIDVAALLSSCVELWHAFAAERGIALRLAPGEELAALHADEVMLRRVLDNLVKNAIEAIEQGPGEVVLSAALPTRGKMRIAVEDSGPGVPDGIDVFKLFETTKTDGTGIGLAVAKQIVEAHGGVIEHLSRSPRGTIFRIELPLGGPSTRTTNGPSA